MTNLNSLREAIAESPSNVPLLLLYAHSCLDELSFGEARKGYEKVLALKADNVEAKLGVARVLFMTGRTSEAAVRAQCVLEDEPKFAPAHLFLSRVYLSEEDPEEAMKHYRKAMGINKSISDPALEKDLAAVKRERRGSRAGKGKEGQRGSRDAVESDYWLLSGDGADEDDEMPSFFDELEGYEEAEGASSSGFSLEDFRRPEGNFAVVGGMEDLKEEIRMKIVYPLQRPELFRAYGKKSGGSVLLYGPPGCGKTLISRAIAGETSAHFFEVSLHHVLEMYVGDEEKNLHQVFELAREFAPSVIFIDDLDSLCAGEDASKGMTRTLMNQLLEELDRESVATEGVFVIAATSSPWKLEEAVFHAGRFDRKVIVPLPDSRSRKAILRVLAEDKPIIDLDLNYLAGKTEGFSGAELKAMFDMATEDALGLAIKEDRIIPLTMAMLVRCAKRLRPMAARWERKFREMERKR